MDARGIDTDPGWINRKLQALERAIEALRSERRAGATTVDGTLVVETGGNILLEDFARLDLQPGAQISSPGFYPFPQQIIVGSTGLLPTSTGWQIKLSRPAGESVFHASSDGTSRVDVGANGSPIDAFRVDATDISLLGGNVTVTGSMKLFTSVTTSASANLAVDAVTGVVARSTSSRKYKQDIADADIDPAAVLKMRARSWRDKAEVAENPDTPRRYIGFVAEELHDLGLTEFVTYDDEGRPDAIAYDRLSVALLSALRSVAKQAKDRSDALEVRLAALEAKTSTATTTTTTRST